MLKGQKDNNFFVLSFLLYFYVMVQKVYIAHNRIRWGSTNLVNVAVDCLVCVSPTQAPFAINTIFVYILKTKITIIQHKSSVFTSKMKSNKIVS